MAIKEIKREWSPCQLDYVKTFLLHSEKELKDLPKCCIGSKAIVSETDNEYFCTESGWKLGSELGGGGEVVILPETEIAAITESPIANAPNAMPEVGKVCTVTYNGTAYDCPAVAVPEGLDVTGIALGNSDALGIPGGNATAPFVVVLFDAPVDTGDGIAYGLLLPVGGGEEGTYVTLSIVQTEGAASGGAADSPVVIAKMTGSGDAISIDKTFDEIVALVTSGKIVYLQSISDTAAMTLLLTNYTGSSTPKTLFFAGQNAGRMVVTVTYTPDGVTMGIENH